MKIITRLFVPILMAGAAGCVVPESEHPLSNEKTSVLDERLIGRWEKIPDEGEKHGEVIALQRVRKTPNILVMVFQDTEEGRTVERRLPVYMTEIAGLRYFSIDAKGQEEKQAKYLLVMYQFHDHDELRMYAPHSDVIAQDIERGRLAGQVKRRETSGEDPNEQRPYEQIRITAAPEKLRDYIKAKGATCYHIEEPMRFRRIDPMKKR